jgi:hypothetical protein
MTKVAAPVKAIQAKEAPMKTAPTLHYGPQPFVSSATLGRATTVTDLRGCRT